MTISDIETADRASRRRARGLPFLAILFILQQVSYFTGTVEDGTRTVDQVRIGAWLVLTVVLLLYLATGGSWLQRRPVRALLNDEVSRANRLEGMRAGFLAAMIAGIVIYALTYFDQMTARETVHLIITVGIAAALLRFGFLERRGHRDG
jgi:predicted CDP-diglyceride synthetase/phosphatidate cytidylyltransferase